MKSPLTIFGLLAATLLFGNFHLLASVSEEKTQDGLSRTTRSAVEGLMRRNPPRLTFSPAKVSADSFPAWQAQMKTAMERLMRHPQAQAASPRDRKSVV